MSGPDGQITKRDQRREARRQQLQREQAARKRQRERQIRQRRVRTGAIAAAGILAVLIIGLLVAHFAFGALGGSASVQQAAHGQVIDGLSCTTPSSSAHYQHTYVKIYVNGTQTNVPAGVGIVSAKNCHYPVYVLSGTPNAVAAFSGNTKYVLGHLFDLWGQPLSSTQIMGYKADASHKLTFEVTDASGHLQPYLGDPRGIELSDHTTIVALYNSSHVNPTPFTDWNHLNG
jgi:hypothetical protein